MDFKTFKLSKDDFKNANQKKSFTQEFQSGANLQAIEEEQRKRDEMRMREHMLYQNDQLNMTLETQNRRGLSDYAAERQLKKIDELLQESETTEGLVLDEESKTRLHSIKSRTLVEMLLRMRGSDSPEMAEIKSNARELENFLASRNKMKLSPEMFETMEVSFRMTLASMENYLSNPKKRENNRKKMVRQVWTALSFEADRLMILHERAMQGEFANQTVEDFMGLDRDMTMRRTRVKEKEGPEKASLSKDGKSVSALFKEKLSISDQIRKENSTQSGREQASKGYLELRDILRSLPEGKVVVKDVTILGKKVRLIQRSDNSLSIFENGNEFQLEVTALYAADRIESDMAANSGIYGDKALEDIFLNLKGTEDFLSPEQMPSGGELERMRHLMSTYMESKLGVAGTEFANIPLHIMRAYAISAARGEITAEDIRKELENYQSEKDSLINTMETRQIMEKHQNDPRVEMRLPKTEKFADEDDESGLLWTEKEKSLLNFVADLIFDQDTWTADEKTLKEMNPADRLRTLLGKHKEAIRFLIKSPIDVEDMIDKLPLPEIMIEEEEEEEKEEEKKEGEVKQEEKQNGGEEGLKQEEQKKAKPKKMISLRESMKKGLRSMLNEPAMQMLSKIPDASWLTLGKDLFGAAVEKAGEEQLPDKIAGVIETKDLKKAFEEMAGSLDKVVNEFTKNLQNSMNDIVKNIFGDDGEDAPQGEEENLQNQNKEVKEEEVKEGEKKENAEEEAEKRRKEIKKKAAELAAKKKAKEDEGKSELKRIMEDCAKGKAGIGKFNKKVMTSYFGGVSMIDKRSMISSMIRGLKPLKSLETPKGILVTELRSMYLRSGSSLFMNATHDELTPEEQKIYEEYAKEKRESNIAANIMSGVLKGAGPLMQKMMQGMPLDSLPEGIRGAVKDMKSNLAPIPEKLVQSSMTGIVERSHGSITKIEVLKSLGAASVGQAFLCKLYGKRSPEGKNVVIKLLRPDVLNRMAREEKIMLKAAEDTDEGMLATYKGQLANIKKELNLTREAKNVEAGVVYNNRHADVESMKLDYTVEPTANTMICECAEGTTVDKYLDSVAEKIESIHERFYEKDEEENKNLASKQKHMKVDNGNMALVKTSREELMAELKKLEKMRDHVCNLCDIWVRQGMLEKGFYHGDLHAGNIMISEDKATVIDFGNAVQLTANNQKWIIGMLTAAISGDGALFAEGFEQLLDKKDDAEFMAHYNEVKPQLVQTFIQVLSKGSEDDAGDRIMVALLKAQELGVEIPDSIYNFAQGQIRLMNTVNEMNEMMDVLMEEIDKMGRLQSGQNYPVINPFMMTQSRILKTMGSSDAEQKAIYEAQYATLHAANEEEILQDVTDEKKAKEFESKYLKPYCRIREFLRGSQAKITIRIEAGDEIDTDSLRKAKPFDYNGKAQKVRDYIEKYKDKVGTQEQIDAANALGEEVMILSAGDKYLDAFGGSNLLYNGMPDALINMNVEHLRNYIDVLENQMPKAAEMLDKYEELREAQKNKAPNAGQLAQEFASLLSQAEQNKVLFSSMVLSVKDSLHRETVGLGSGKTAEARPIYYRDEIEPMFAFSYKPEGAEEPLGQTLKKAYERLVECEKKEKEEKTEEAVNARIEAENAFIKQYTVNGYYQLKTYSESTYEHLKKPPKKRDFVDVMGDILKGRVRMAVQSLPKVGFVLGYKMAKALLFPKKAVANAGGNAGENEGGNPGEFV